MEKICHPKRVKVTGEGKKQITTIALSFPEEQMEWVREIAKHAYKGCVCDTVANMFLDRLEEVMKSAVADMADESSPN